MQFLCLFCLSHVYRPWLGMCVGTHRMAESSCKYFTRIKFKIESDGNNLMSDSLDEVTPPFCPF
jgi:hypothetical protein